MKKSTLIWGVVLCVLAIQIYKISDEDSGSSEDKGSAAQVQEQNKSASNAASVSNAVDEAIVDVSKIAGKSQAEVNKLLGKPLKTEKFDFEMGPNFTPLPVTMNYYLEMLEGEMGRVEIMFVDGGAQRIQVNLIGNEYYKDDERNKNLAYAGLQVIELDPPVNEVQKVSIKDNVFGFHRVSAADWLGTDNGNVEIITKEKYE